MASWLNTRNLCMWTMTAIDWAFPYGKYTQTFIQWYKKWTVINKYQQTNGQRHKEDRFSKISSDALTRCKCAKTQNVRLFGFSRPFLPYDWHTQSNQNHKVADVHCNLWYEEILKLEIDVNCHWRNRFAGLKNKRRYLFLCMGKTQITV